jgi:hypothetical protein
LRLLSLYPWIFVSFIAFDDFSFILLFDFKFSHSVSSTIRLPLFNLHS